MKKKALALMSGGLDSLLAARVMLEQGVHVEGVNFFSGFSGDTPEELQATIPLKLHSHGCRKIADQLGIKLHVINIFDEFKTAVMQCPKYGFGAHLNPCLDCKLFMIGCAQKWMVHLGFDFLVSGEVLGQRPMSQRKDTLPLADKSTGGLILRPLSARLLEETVPERNGWVRRENLYAISGRSRKPQMELARHFGLHNYQQPAGGCVLTDQAYCARLQDVWSCGGCCCDKGVGVMGVSAQHGAQVHANAKHVKEYTLHDVMLARLGRHLRVSPDLKLVVGRDQSDNEALRVYQDLYPTMITADFPGAIVLLQAQDECGCGRGGLHAHNLELAASIAARFSQASKRQQEHLVKVELKWPNRSAVEILSVMPLSPADIDHRWYI
jgi:tRNA-uridine 2-sulfurtransferase